MDEFYNELWAVWNERMAKGEVNDNLAEAFRTVTNLIRKVTEEWHNNCTLYDEFWPDFTGGATIEELDEYIEDETANG